MVDDLKKLAVAEEAGLNPNANYITKKAQEHSWDIDAILKELADVKKENKELAKEQQRLRSVHQRDYNALNNNLTATATKVHELDERLQGQETLTAQLSQIEIAKQQMRPANPVKLVHGLALSPSPPERFVAVDPNRLPVARYNYASLQPGLPSNYYPVNFQPEQYFQQP